MINVIDGRGKDINWITGKLNRRSQLTLEEEKISEVLDGGGKWRPGVD